MNNDMLNTMFIEALDNPADLQKLASETSSYVRKQMREASFARKILMLSL